MAVKRTKILSHICPHMFQCAPPHLRTSPQLIFYFGAVPSNSGIREEKNVKKNKKGVRKCFRGTLKGRHNIMISLVEKSPGGQVGYSTKFEWQSCAIYCKVREDTHKKVFLFCDRTTKV